MQYNGAAAATVLDIAVHRTSGTYISDVGVHTTCFNQQNVTTQHHCTAAQLNVIVLAEES